MMIKRGDRDALDCAIDPEFRATGKGRFKGDLPLLLAQGKTKNSINTDEDEEEDENAIILRRSWSEELFASQHAWRSMCVFVPSSPHSKT